MACSSSFYLVEVPVDTTAPDTKVRWKSISGMPLAFLGIAWFAARRGARWAPWALLVSGVIWVPYYFVIASDFGAFGAKDTFMAAVMVSMYALPAVVGAALMLVAPRRKAFTERWALDDTQPPTAAG